jgi:protein NirF
MKKFISFLSLIFALNIHADDLRATGDLGLVIERESNSALIINTSQPSRIAKIQGLGDLSHASVVFSRDERFAYVFGRDGGLNKIDMLTDEVEKRIIQGGNSIGGAISQNGKIIAVSNYQPAGVKLFSADTLELIAEIPAIDAKGQFSKTVGLVDAPNQKFVVSLFDAGEIWVIDVKNPKSPHIEKFTNIGKQPYDALISPDGRYYIAGLFGEKGLALLDLWHPELGVKRILANYGKDDEQLPVYKMPHFEGWAMTSDYVFVPAVGRHEVLAMDKKNWQLVKTIPVIGQPVFVMARPDGRQIWVNFAMPDNSQIQIIDADSLNVTNTFSAGKAALHFEFTPRGEQVWIALRDDDAVAIYDTDTLKEIARLPAEKPNGIFFSARAHRIGM